MTQRSTSNNTNVALGPFGIFTGAWETTNVFLEISCYVESSQFLAIGIQQSQDASGIVIDTTQNYIPTDEVTVFNTAVGLPFYRIVVTNETATQVAHMSVNTLLSLVPSLVTINGGDVVVSGSVSATVTNLITETLATRRVDFLVVGDYYRVASVGITTGAQWNAIGAIVDGESEPKIGRLFKCLQVGPAVAGGGECYDVEYTDDVSATITNFPSFPATQAVTGTVGLTDPTTVRVRDTYGDPIVTTAGNLMVGIGNIYTANPLHVIVDSVTLPTTSVAGALAVSTTGITLKATTGKLLTLHINSDGALGTNFVKIYNVAVPTNTDTPIFTIGVLFGSSQNVDCSSLNFATAIGVRCTNAAAAGDNTPSSNTVNVTAFFV